MHDFSTMGMKYKDEEDKCYGIAGMAIGIAVCNGEDMLYRLDIDITAVILLCQPKNRGSSHSSISK